MKDYKTPKEFIQHQMKIRKLPLFGWLENIEEFDVVNTKILYNKDDKENDIIRIECAYQDGKNIRMKTLEYYKTLYDEFLINNRDEKITKLLGED